MASAWNIVRAVNYNSVPENNENEAVESPVPDKFKQRFTMNTLRMSLRKRIPLKRINADNVPQSSGVTGLKKQKIASSSSLASSDKKRTGIAVEKSVKKTFYRVTEQLTGTARKTQLKDTPQKCTPRTRYRERLRSPPATPISPANPFDSPVCGTPLSQVKRKQISRTPMRKKVQRSTPRKGTAQNFKQSPNEFSQHLELVSCGIQQLETNGSNMAAALSHIKEDYMSSPLQSKLKSCQNRLWRNEMKRYAPVGECTSEGHLSENTNQSTRSKLRRTMTRMSLRVKNRPSMRSTKSASCINTHCFDGPMTAEPKKLAPLRDYVTSGDK